MGFPHPIHRKLVFLTAVFLQLPADFIIQMEGISENGEWNMIFFHQLQQFPEIRVQDRVAARDIEIRRLVLNHAEIRTFL